MTTQTLEQPAAVGIRRHLTVQEVERITQPLHERSLLEMKAEWKRRFNATKRKAEKPRMTRAVKAVRKSPK